MRHFNSTLHQYRIHRGLTIKELSKQLHISRFQLYLMEKGYMKPSVGQLAVIDRFFNSDFAPLLEGEASYPVPVDVPEESKQSITFRQKLGRKWTKTLLLSGAILSFLVAAAGGGCFAAAHFSGEEMFGESYSSVRSAVMAQGMHSYDTITGAETYTYSGEQPDDFLVHLSFQRNSSLLYFNTNFASYATLTERYIYEFGFNMSVSSYVCEFTYGIPASAEYGSCRFDLNVNGPITQIYSVKRIVDAEGMLTDEMLLECLNARLGQALEAFTTAMTSLTGKRVDFETEFLPDREFGRVRNFRMQTAGALMGLIGLALFIALLFLFLYGLFANSKPKLEVASIDEPNRRHHRSLPTDPSMTIGIPETVIRAIGIGALLAAAIIYMAMLFRQFSMGIVASSQMARIASVAMTSGIFLIHFLNFEIKSRDYSFLSNLLLFGGFYLALSGAETILLLVARTWGYSIQDLFMDKLPANIFGIATAHYLIMFFLFFQPSFIARGRKWRRILWPALSILPVGFLVASYIIGNYDALVYGAKYDALAHIWFPNAFIALSVVCVIYLYGVFFLRLFFMRRYGTNKANIFFGGNTFSFLKNLLGAGAILLVGLIDFFLRENPYSAFLGIGDNYWIMLLIPFVLFHKHHIGPRNSKLDNILTIIYFVLYWVAFAGVLIIVLTHMV